MGQQAADQLTPVPKSAWPNSDSRRPVRPAERGADESPLGFAAGDTNLYRYVGNTPTTATDPSGLAELPHGTNWPGQPFAPSRPPVLNTVTALPGTTVGQNLALLLFTYSRPTLLNNVPRTRPRIELRPPAASTIVLGGSGFGWGGTLQAGQSAQVSGCGPCVGLILVKPGSPTFVFHFSASNHVTSSINSIIGSSSLNGYTAYICGAEIDNDPIVANHSAGSLADVLSFLNGHGIPLSYIPAPGMAVNSTGMPIWIYPGTNNFPTYGR
jgi:hypothetical protein